MASKKLDRRTFLRGAAGTALALPALECMLGPFGQPAWAQENSTGGAKRYFVAFAGMSIGAHEDPPDDGDAASKTFIPKTVGSDYELTTGLAPLGATVQLPNGEQTMMKDYVSVVSNLIIPTPSDVGSSDIPPGGRPDDFHKRQLSPLFTATRFDPDTVRNGQAKYYNGTSSDQIVSQAWNDARSLVYRAQYRYYSNGNPDAEGLPRTTLSTRMEGGQLQQILPTINPAQAYMDLFGMGTDPTESDVDPRRKLLNEARKGSVLDLVTKSYQTLRGRVGAGDRIRLERHTHELRELEKRLESFTDSRACSTPMVPESGWDRDAFEPWANQSISSDGSPANWAWNDEDVRAELLGDIIFHAFKCGIADIATLCLTLQQSFMSCQHLCGIPQDIHGTGHVHGNGEDVEMVAAWHVRLWSRVLKRLAETPEVPGSDETMLDNTAAVLLFEGGYGENFEKPDSSSYHFWSTHSTQNMAVLVGGGAGGLTGNVHVKTNQEHPATCLMSAMEAVGVSRSKFGDLSWKVQPELFG